MVPGPESALALAPAHNLKIMLEDGLLNIATANSEEKLAELDKLIERVKNNPALEAYYVFDEPQVSDFPQLLKIVSRIKKHDRNHFCFINLLPVFGVRSKMNQDPCLNYRDYVEEYVRQFKPGLLSYDYYNFARESGGKPNDGQMYFVHLHLMRNLARAAHVPFMNIIQACHWDNTYRFPTAAEMRWQVYTSLAYGARGISYFLYWGPAKFGGLYRDGQATPLVKDIAKLNREIAAFSPVLMKVDSVAVYPLVPPPPSAASTAGACDVQVLGAGEFLLGLFGEGRKSNSFMIVNRRCDKVQTAVLTVQNANQLLEFNRATSAWTKVVSDSAGHFSITLQPGDGRFFRYR